MTVGEFLNRATKALQQAGIESARLDTLVLLEQALGEDRALILAHPERQIPPLTDEDLNTKIVQRATHVPLAYLLGTAYFYGRRFAVTAAVLCPRPETEAMIDLLKTARFALRQAGTLRFADIGCGSGCIGITAALEVPESEGYCLDISPAALAVAKENINQFDAKCRLVQSDLLQALPNDYFDALLANLPYVPDTYEVNQAARHEPAIALYAGQDGLDLYRRFWLEVGAIPTDQKPALVFTESLPHQHTQLAALARTNGYSLGRRSGLIQEFGLATVPEPRPASR